MILSFLFVFVSFLFGFSSTLLMKEEFIFEERFFYGALVGLVFTTWIGFVYALLFGLDLNTIKFTSSLLLFSSLLILYLTLVRGRNQLSFRNIFHSEVFFQILSLSCIFFNLFYFLFSRIILWREDGLYTGLAYNLGDLPYHWSIINSFLYGDNFPPENTIFSGVTIRYYFLSDFFTAMLTKSGLSLAHAFTLQGISLSIVLLATVYLFTYRFTKNKIASAISPFLFFLNGGLGFVQFFKDLISERGNLLRFLSSLNDYTKIDDLGYRWINTTTSLLVPQRPFLFGFPMSILVLTMLWQGVKSHKKGYFAVAGLVAGSLPLFHAHSSLSLGIISVILFFLFPSRGWLWFFIPAGLLTLPQAYYLMPSGESAGRFFTFHLGWMSNQDNIFWFYLKNSGLFIPILIGTLILSRSLSVNQKKFAIPFVIIFLVANVIQFTPWDWDNVKILIYFSIGSIPFVSYGLACLWNSKFKVLSILLFLSLILSGITSVVRGIQGLYQENNKEEIELAETIKKLTDPQSRFLTAPTFNHLILLTGRGIVHGYPGSLWGQGVNIGERLNDVRRMYRGANDTKDLLIHYGIDYVVIGPPEEGEKMEPNLEFYKNNFPILLKSENYYVFKIRDGP